MRQPRQRIRITRNSVRTKQHRIRAGRLTEGKPERQYRPVAPLRSTRALGPATPLNRHAEWLQV
jgi:hypothetical protein